jgi:thiol-disulfide isomerase/thioredoxin
MILALFFSFLSTVAAPATPTRGILNQKAPSLEVSEWFHLPEGKKSLDISDFAGKVVYLYCFQSWCPGCHSHGFPALQKVIKEYQDDPDVAILAVQTTFEGYSHNGVKQAKEVAKRYSLSIPIGQSGDRNQRSKLMSNYRTGGTPWTIIIDRDGHVRYNDFHVDPDYAMTLIDKFKQKQPAKDAE